MAPLTVAVGGAAKVGSETIMDLPADLVLPAAPKASVLYAADGETPIATFGDQYRVDLTAEEIPETVRDAVVAVEDERFFEHNGVDPRGVMRAAVTNMGSGEASEGASTITMQYVRQVLAYTAASPDEVAAATEVTPDRKVKEMGYALALEKEMTKEEILTGYLNTVYFGHGAYGIGAAARTYFNKTTDELTRDEAALLAGLVKNPNLYDPISGSTEAATKRRNHVLERELANDFISQSEYTSYTLRDIELDPHEDDGDQGGAIDSEYGFFVDYFERWWSQQEDFGASPEQRRARLDRGGYEIISTLDLDMQEAAEEAIEENIATGESFALGSAAVEPGTGAIQTMAINRNYSLDISDNGDNTGGPGKGTYPNTTNPLLSGNSDASGFQAGSSFKLFTQIAALEQGYTLDTSIYSPFRYPTGYAVGDDGPASCGGFWCPKNAVSSMHGTFNMWSAFGQSINTYYVQLIERIGAEKVVDVASRMGIKFRAAKDRSLADDPGGWGQFTLGVSDTTAVDLASSYAVLAADGMYCSPMPATEITTGKGDTTVVEPECRRALDTEISRAALDAARCTTGYGAVTGKCGGGGTASDMARQVGGPVAGKTGTSDEDRTSWFAGFTPNTAVSTFTGDPDQPNRTIPRKWRGASVDVSTQVLRESWDNNPEGSFTPPESHIR